MRKFVFVLTILSLLAGSCLAYTVSGTVYEKGTTIPVPAAAVFLDDSSGSSTSTTTDSYGSFSVGWAGVNKIGDTMTLRAVKGPRHGQKVWTAQTNSEHKDVEISAMLVVGTHLVVTPEPVHYVGAPGPSAVVCSLTLQTPGPIINVQNAQINVVFNGPVVGAPTVGTTPSDVIIKSTAPIPGGLQVEVEFEPPRDVPDFPAESFFDVMFEVDIPESDTLLATVTVEDSIFNFGTIEEFGVRPSVTELLVGQHVDPSPYFLIDSEEEWNEGLIMEWPDIRIIPMTAAEGNHPEWGYLIQMKDFHVEGEPYSPIDPELPDFIPPGLFIYPGGDDGQSSPVDDPEDAGLVMTWGENDVPDGDRASAWKLEYGDPDLSNCIITVTAIPPGPSGISRISLGMQDINGNIRSWWWNVPGAIPYNVPTTVTIDTTQIGLAAANPPASGFANNPAFDLTKVQNIIADENATWVSGAGAPVPGTGVARIWNYWNNLSVAPKLPATGANSKWYVKYSQPPVEIEPGKIIGWDEVSGGDSDEQIMADDWECSDERPITDIHWWGSFKGWTQPHLPPILPIAFRIGIWTDVPAGVDQTYSHPGQLIWENECTTSVWNFAGYDVDPRCDDTSGQYPCEENEACFQWAQFLNQDEWFHQEGMQTLPDGTVVPNIYWLSIAAVYAPDVDYADADFFPWGWKTREHFFNDDAIRINNATQWPPVVGAIWTGGDPVEFPAGVSWDLAFELTTNEPKCPGLTADLNNDCIVSLPDFAIMAGEWLMTSP